MTNYAIDDSHGQNIVQGLHNSDGNIRRRAQQIADDRGETVLLYRENGPHEGVGDETFAPLAVQMSVACAVIRPPRPARSKTCQSIKLHTLKQDRCRVS